MAEVEGPTAARKPRTLGAAQLYILKMVDPEWITLSPDARSLRVLRSLEARGLTYQNRGRWYISVAGKEALRVADLKDATDLSPASLVPHERGDK